MRQPALIRHGLRWLASPVLTMSGFVLLAGVLLLTGTDQGRGVPPTAWPLGLLAINLAAAMCTRPRLRRGGLGVFHVALLGVMLLAGWGRLTHFDGRIEVTEGTAADPGQVEVLAQGPWHAEGWRHLAFEQGGFEVDYAAGTRRSHTRSQVQLPDEDAARTVGDDTPLLLGGYRLYTTHNKGFAPVLTWTPAQGEPVVGSVHMPSYPLFDWKQSNSWNAPDGTAVKFWLRIEPPSPDHSAWTLSARQVRAVLVVEAGGQRSELRPGESVALDGGATLRYERLAGWMGYRIFHDPTLLPMLALSLLGVLALGWHLWGRGVPRGAGKGALEAAAG